MMVALRISEKVLLLLLLILFVASSCSKGQIVRPVNELDEKYVQGRNTGQLDNKTIQTLKERFPADFFKGDRFIIPSEMQLAVAIEPFKTIPTRSDVSQMTTDAFTSVFVDSGLFKVVEQDFYSKKIVSNTREDDTVMTSGRTLQLKTSTDVDCIVRGTVNHAEEFTLFAEVLDTDSGYIMISKKLSSPTFQRINAETLARMVLTPMVVHYYQQPNTGKKK